MIARLLGRETPETTTLELIGLVGGAYKPGTVTAADGYLVAKSMLRKVNTALREAGRLMDTDSKALLLGAKGHLAELAKDSSSYMLVDRRPNPAPMTYPDVVTNPVWSDRFEAFQSAMKPLASAVFKDKYAADVEAKYAGADRPARDQAAKRDLGLRIAISGGM
ncbi:MAG: hypothetical protein AAF556_11305 [Pseudomonadota bacterium]